MTEKLVREETPVEFFREQLERAMEHQRVSASVLTEYYLVNLLAVCVHRDPLPPAEDGFEETPLALLYVKALEASRYRRARILRALGDTALFVSGFFADSLARKLVDLGYYHKMGGQAYARLSLEDAALEFGTEVFRELAQRFTQFADLLSEVSETSRLTSHQSVVALYERWLQTGSRRAARLLGERGINPVAPGEVRLQ